MIKAIFIGACACLLAGCAIEPGTSGATTEQRHSIVLAGPSRSFQISSIAKLANLPPGTHRVDLWIPIPSSDEQQTISDLKVDTSFPHEIQTDPDYSNQILHVWSDRPEAMTVRLHLDCTRREEHVLPPDLQENVSKSPVASDRFLQADRLGVIDDQIRSLAAQITAGKSDVISKARAIYDYVIDHMAYDKATPGWGNGDTLRACAVGKGNCTDFSALFISLARASGIKARFKMGCQIPPTQHEGPIAGYHCWAEFWSPEIGWVPVDASEAWKNPTRRDFYFGALDDNRVQFSYGRDVRVPGIHGEPLNYFFAPYAESDGKPLAVDRVLSVSEK